MEPDDVDYQFNNNYEKHKQVTIIKSSETKPYAKLDLAYERYMNLVAKPEEGLVLPDKHKVLNDYFRAVDTVISILYNRQEVSTFSKVQSHVQEMMKNNFSCDILGQIKTVFPEAYIFRQDKIKTRMGNFEYNLVVTPYIQYKASASKQLKMSSAVLSERRYIFLTSLIQIIKVHHATFLATLNEPVFPMGELKSWHSEFDLTKVPDVEVSSLPQASESDKFESSSISLESNQDIVSELTLKVNLA